MKLSKPHFIRIFAVLIFGVLVPPSQVTALERWLVPNTSQCADDTNVNPCHTTMSDAVTRAAAGDSIRILPGTYPANVTITTKNLTIFGDETARTFLDGGGGAAIVINGVTTAMAISNLTFLNAAPAISVTTGSTQVTIKNNVFLSTNTGIQSDNASTPVILNNTFYDNGTAINSTQNNVTIVNNIFYSSDLAISSNVALDNIQYNLFNPISTAGPPGIVFDSTDPLDTNNKWNISGEPSFVNPAASNIAQRDFHLKNDSVCKQKGTTSFGVGANRIDDTTPPDIGAYGGSGSDTIPFPVSGLSGTENTATSVNFNWSANLAYQIAGYNVYHNINKAGPPYDNGPQNAGNVITYTLNVTVPPAPALTAPANLQSTVAGSGALKVTWSAVSGATGYEVSYKKTTEPTFIPLPTVTIPEITISGLTDPDPNGIPTLYDISVRAFYQTTVNAAVKSHYAAATPSKEALAFSDEAVIPIGSLSFGTSSAIQDFPEPITPYPALPNKGCFIATAAYGYYSAPQVLALRQFRDRYLVTNAPGRAFVAWYYRVGPELADFITQHPSLRLMARTALLPAVGFARFMTHTTPMMKLTVLLSLAIACILIILSVRAVLVRNHPERRPR